MHPDWTALLGGATGSWRLESLIRAGGDTADYAGTDGEAKAWVRVALAGSEAAHNLSRVAELGLSNGHLLRIQESGATALDGARLYFAALEMPEDDIAQILASRKLDADEARAMTSAAATALLYLHDLGLSHNSVVPSSMFIAGDEVKLGVETVGPAGEGTMAADLKQLGTTLVSAMAQAGDQDGRRLPSPFREIARGCLDSERNKWTAARVLDVLAGRPEPVPALPVAVAPSAAAAPPRVPSKRLPVVAAALGLTAVGVFMYRSMQDPAPAAQPELKIAVVKEVPDTGKPSAMRSAAQGDSRQPKPARKPSAPMTEAAAPRTAASNTADRVRGSSETGGNWAVIAATYNTESSAQGRAGRMAAQAPGLKPEIYHPSGSSRYFIVLGSGMSREEAERFLQTAKQKGAPADAYVTKLNRS